MNPRTFTFLALPALGAGRFQYALGVVCALMAGCGGGGGGDSPPPPTGPAIVSFTADQASYYVGGTAQLTAVFSNGSGHLEPGTIAIASGQPVTTPALSEDLTYRLVVTNGSTTVTRDLAIDVGYRDRMRTINMPFARAEHSAATLPDGRVLIIGGDDARGGTLPTAIYQFEPSTETFSKLGDLSSGRIAMVSVTLASGDVLVAYGGKALTQAPDSEIINGRTGGVTPTVGKPIRVRYHATATALADGRVLITGGSGQAGADNTAEIYDTSTGSFALLASTMAKGRYAHTATRLNNGQVFLYGGYTNDSLPAPPELFDPATSAFTTLPSAENSLRANHVAVKARDGRVWILGGDDELSTPIATVLRFDSETRFAFGPNLGVPRTFLGGAALTDGRVVLSGGQTSYSSADIEASSELVSGLQSRSNGPAMVAPRFLHTVSELPNGRALIVGGLNHLTTPLETAEIFE